MNKYYLDEDYAYYYVRATYGRGGVSADEGAWPKSQVNAFEEANAYLHTLEEGEVAT